MQLTRFVLINSVIVINGGMIELFCQCHGVSRDYGETGDFLIGTRRQFPDWGLGQPAALIVSASGEIQNRDENLINSIHSSIIAPRTPIAPCKYAQ